MKSKRLTVRLNKPVYEVFKFVIDPTNTPKWIDSIVVEETNEWPVKLGSIYKNQDRAREWRSFEVTEFEENKMFVMSNRKTGYKVRYTLSPIVTNSTELEYYEWMDSGELEEPFTQDILDKLKKVIETGNT